MFSPDIVILCAGDYPDNTIPLSILDNAQRIVCCDSAAEVYIERTGRKPWKIIGDCDSLSPEVQKKYEEILIHVSEQENNDLTKAVLYSQSQGFKHIAILGATGKREDHTLGNISLLMDYQEMGLDVRMFTDNGVFIPCSGITTFEYPVNTKVSVFNFGATEMSSEGLEYPLYDLKKLWQGTLNRVVTSPFTIKAQGNYLVFINY